jgi:integrase
LLCRRVGNTGRNASEPRVLLPESPADLEPTSARITPSKTGGAFLSPAARGYSALTSLQRYALSLLLRGSDLATHKGSIINKQLVPRLGAIAVSALRFDHIDAAVSGMIEDELSSKTIHNTVTLLRTMLAGKRGPSALRRGFAFHDPTMGLELPPLESRQITPPTPERVWALIGSAKGLGGLGYALAYTGAFTGVRRNEALGLRFNDIEWFGNEVNVRHAISKRRGTDGAHKWEWHVGPPKSRKSLRRIAATESVMKMLADLKVGKPDGAFIFPAIATAS